MTQLETGPAVTDEPVDHRAVAERWLADLDRAVSDRDFPAVRGLLAADPWWRDIYALTWDLVGMHGADDIVGQLAAALDETGFGDLRLDATWPVAFNGRYIEAIYHFTTRASVGRGVVRLVREEDGAWRSWVVSTALEGLRDFPEPTVSVDDAASEANNTPSTPGARRSLAELRAERRQYRDADPSVLIVGAGHSGLFLAARLGRLGVPTLLVDRYARAGDNWRLRYNGLLLHDFKWSTEFPYLPYPTTWPLFTPKEMLADWMEAYVNLLDLDLWTSTTVHSATYDEAEGRWTVELDHDGERRTLYPQHLVFATGKDGIPHRPEIEGEELFQGTIAHSSAHPGGESVRGKRVVVVGAGASAHDIAQDAYENEAASITMVQRSPVLVFSQRNGLKLLFGALYHENGPEVATADLLAAANPLALALRLAPTVTRRIAELDADLIAGLEKAGFRTTLGPGDAGQAYLTTRGGGAVYIDKGNCRLIIDGEIRIQPGEVARFTPHGVVYRDGTEEPADVVVFCTGYSNMREVVRPVVGDEVADQLATVWNVDDRGELRTTLRHSGHRKLWFMATGLRLARFHSQHVALLIKAMNEGVIDPRINVDKKQDLAG
ncbi:NAD(P)/FAD-dependent oxidoreductase [Yinghuangia sp. ASG 101]|uniref:FAD-dependent oxidoreductase n=1 Tax=Yinghuangia sp. ASG 101 TaxID=2896848 RepID=UPI001E2BBD29|nr:NAD(P)/FAD-dependent oxidoreductase [Yinghuangia sp. ASG 101]UGQ11127.1 NAD(P)/FAD-dependent oxidoreductase [Yinghuangia sp. ASG 101]